MESANHSAENVIEYRKRLRRNKAGYRSEARRVHGRKRGHLVCWHALVDRTDGNDFGGRQSEAANEMASQIRITDVGGSRNLKNSTLSELKHGSSGVDNGRKRQRAERMILERFDAVASRQGSNPVPDEREIARHDFGQPEDRRILSKPQDGFFCFGLQAAINAAGIGRAIGTNARNAAVEDRATGKPHHERAALDQSPGHGDGCRHVHAPCKVGLHATIGEARHGRAYDGNIYVRQVVCSDPRLGKIEKQRAVRIDLVLAARSAEESVPATRQMIAQRGANDPIGTDDKCAQSLRHELFDVDCRECTRTACAIW